MLAVFPLAGALFSNYLNNLFYSPGVMVGLGGILLISIAGMTAFCISSGMMFTVLASFHPYVKNAISRIYSIEAAGSLAGGLLFNFILVYSLNSIHILYFLMIINMILAAWYSYCSRKWIAGSISMLISVVLLISIFFIDPDKILSVRQYEGQTILLQQTTPFGDLVVSEQHGQINYYQSGKPLFSSNDLIDKEEKVHYAMALHPSPKKVLMLEGGLDGSILEVLKYHIDRADYADPNKWLMEAVKEHKLHDWPSKINVSSRDARNFLQQIKEKYDVILLNSASPTNIGSNRFYTEQFFGLVKSRMNEAAILSLHLPSSSNYLRDESLELFSSVYNTLEHTFNYIRIIHGNTIYLLA